jgi:hypothetical protein
MRGEHLLEEVKLLIKEGSQIPIVDQDIHTKLAKALDAATIWAADGMASLVLHAYRRGLEEGRGRGYRIGKDGFDSDDGE